MTEERVGLRPPGTAADKEQLCGSSTRPTNASLLDTGNATVCLRTSRRDNSCHVHSVPAFAWLKHPRLLMWADSGNNDGNAKTPEMYHRTCAIYLGYAMRVEHTAYFTHDAPRQRLQLCAWAARADELVSPQRQHSILDSHIFHVSYQCRERLQLWLSSHLLTPPSHLQ